MAKTGYADLPLHYGRVPLWLSHRMEKLGGAITQTIVEEYGKSELLKRISDPFWFQSLGAVLGMDWHSSGITTSLMGALKKAVNPISHELGIHICGGRGRHSRKTPLELTNISAKMGLNGDHLVRCSRLSAKIDSTAVQDGYQVYLHNFIVTNEGEWAVVQQGMNEQNGFARRYHWHSKGLDSFLSDPHSSVCGLNQGLILNMVHQNAGDTRKYTLEIASEHPTRMIQEIKNITLPSHHDVKIRDVDLKRLGAVITLAHESEISEFENLLLIEGLGPRTLQSLVLVSEIIHGTPSRFSDPARFSFAHGGKDGHPFPVPTKVYDEVIDFMNKTVDKSKIDHSDKQKAFKKLHELTIKVEKDFIPDENKYQSWLDQERKNAPQYGGRTVFDGPSKTNKNKAGSTQLKLFN